MLVAQVMAGQYSENGNILLTQTEGEGQVECQNEDLEAIAEYLAELKPDELDKMAKLVQTKIEAENDAEQDDDSLAQMDLDFDDNFDHYLY